MEHTHTLRSTHFPSFSFDFDLGFGFDFDFDFGLRFAWSLGSSASSSGSALHCLLSTAVGCWLRQTETATDSRLSSSSNRCSPFRFVSHRSASRCSCKTHSLSLALAPSVDAARRGRDSTHSWFAAKSASSAPRPSAGLPGAGSESLAGFLNE